MTSPGVFSQCLGHVDVRQSSIAGIWCFTGVAVDNTVERITQ